MKNRHRKIMCLSLCAAMLLTALPFGEVYAADGNTNSAEESKETAGLKAAISEVKKRIDIPKELTEFEYETHTSYGTTYYKLVWYSQKKDRYGDMYTDKSVTVEYFNGFISAYRYYDENMRSRTTPAFAKLSAEEQDKLARKHLKTLDPDLQGNMVIKRDSAEQTLYGETVYYSLWREENGIDFSGNNGNMEIDRDTGKLLSFELTWWNDAKCPDASNILSEEEVTQIYKSRKPLGIRYSFFNNSEYDEEKREWVYTNFILPVYYPTVSGENMIDAITGNYTSYYDDREKYSYTDAYNWEDSDYEDDDIWAYEGVDGEGDCIEEDYSEAELEAIDKESKYISAEQALKIIKDNKYIKFNKELVQSSNYLSSYSDDKGEAKTAKIFEYKYTTDDDTKDSIYLTVTMDAFDGQIISFNKRYDYGKNSPNKNEKPVSKDSAVSVAKKAAEYFMGDRAAEYREDGVWNDGSNKVSKAVTFTRYVNDIPANFDYLSFSVDSRGEVLGFSYTYHDMEFPEGKLVTEEQAYEKLFEKMKPDLYYHGFTDLKLKSHVYLTYKFESSYYINALTGERITNKGMPYYTDNTVTNDAPEPKLYTDIKGHKYEKEIKTLWEYGVRLTDSEKLDPDGAITIGEFIQLIEFTILEETLYDYDTKSAEKLTRSELAKLYVYIYAKRCYEAGAIPGIFVSPYKDVSSSDPYCGYIAIAKSKEFISGGTSFGKDKTVSRAEVLKLVYDYIAAEKEMKLYEIFKI